MKKLIYVTLFIIIFFNSCLTPKVETVEEQIIVKEPEPEPEEIVVEEVVEQPEEVEIPELPPAEPEVFTVTEEEYVKTFDEIEVLISNLNKIISSRDFVNWKKYLSESYISSYGDKEYLQKLSENPTLKDLGIKLKVLRDYFNYVVVPSRSNVVIDEIQFIDENTIKAFTIKNDTKFVVYILVRDNSEWIISD